MVNSMNLQVRVQNNWSQIYFISMSESTYWVISPLRRSCIFQIWLIQGKYGFFINVLKFSIKLNFSTVKYQLITQGQQLSVLVKHLIPLHHIVLFITVWCLISALYWQILWTEVLKSAPGLKNWISALLTSCVIVIKKTWSRAVGRVFLSVRWTSDLSLPLFRTWSWVAVDGIVLWVCDETTPLTLSISLSSGTSSRE